MFSFVKKFQNVTHAFSRFHTEINYIISFTLIKNSFNKILKGDTIVIDKYLPKQLFRTNQQFSSRYHRKLIQNFLKTLNCGLFLIVVVGVKLAM